MRMTYHSLPFDTRVCRLVVVLAFALPTECLLIVFVEIVDQVGLVQPHAFKAALISASPGGHEEVEKSEKKRAPHGVVL
jgi:hypothetical protein